MTTFPSKRGQNFSAGIEQHFSCPDTVHKNLSKGTAVVVWRMALMSNVCAIQMLAEI
jgi:hypothetical protein